MQDSGTERFDLSPAEAAAILGVHEITIKRWAKTGKLVGWKTPGGHWRFRRSDLAALTPAPAEAAS